MAGLLSVRAAAGGQIGRRLGLGPGVRLGQVRLFGRGRGPSSKPASPPPSTASPTSGRSGPGQWELLRRLLGLASKEKRRIAAGVGLLFISSGVTMSVPLAMGSVIDMINAPPHDNTAAVPPRTDTAPDATDPGESESGRRLRHFCLLLCGVFAVGAVSNFGRVYLMRLASQSISARLRHTLYRAIMRRRLAFFDRHATGELVNRLSADTQLVSQTLTQQASDGLRSAFMTAAGAGMMIYMSPQLALVGMAVVPPVAAWAVVTGRKVRGVSRGVQDALAESTQLAEERIANVRTVKAFGKQQLEIDDYRKKMDNVLGISAQEALIHAKFYGMTGLSGNLIILSVLYYGGTLVDSHAISVGHLTSFVLYAAYVGIGLNGVSSSYAELMKAVGASARIWDIVDQDEREVEQNQKTPLLLSPAESLSEADIAFKDVHFSYPSRTDVKIFDGLDLTVPAKKVLAVVGSSGSGKSTLASLILGLYDPNQGSIAVGKHNLSDVPSSMLRERIGLVAQEPVLFSTSIRDNIAYGSGLPLDEVADSDIVMAARQANAHNFISGFPDGYNTKVGERGVLLSGGQKQRVAIARAIIRNPDILILDEATSALDADSEHQVKEALQRVMSGRTVVTIAHRLSTIMNADQIVVLHKGKVVESGKFHDLMAIPGGFFHQLVTKQTIKKEN